MYPMFLSSFVAICAIITGLQFANFDFMARARSSVERANSPFTTNGLFFKLAAVAADHKNCSVIGSSILRRGGNAVDAAIAAMLCTGVVNTHSAGIGGGHFMVIYNKEKGVVEAIDARPEAPGDISGITLKITGKISGKMEQGRCEPSQAGLCVGVPGEISGFWRAHQRHGKLPWKELFQPAIQLAWEGITVGSALSNAILTVAQTVADYPSLRELLTLPSGKLYQSGDFMQRAKYAQTLQRIAQDGPNEFYQGHLAKDIVADIQDEGGIVTLDDLKQYRAKLNRPLKSEIRGVNMFTPPAPSGGPALVMLMNIMKGYSIENFGARSQEEELLWSHRLIEAFKYVLAQHYQLGDSNVTRANEALHNMTSDDFADTIRSRIIDGHTYTQDHYGFVVTYPFSNDTSHVSVVDQSGNAVALTSSINSYFGSAVHGSRTGILFNNVMTNFFKYKKTDESTAVDIKPRERPLSAMSPAIFLDQEDEDVKLVVGSAGGLKIISSNAVVAMETLWFGRDIRQAVMQPRISYDPDEEVVHEHIFDEDVAKRLRHIGHELTEIPERAVFSVVNAIHKEGGGLHVSPEFRKPGGWPAGF